MLVLVRRRGNMFDAVIQALKHANIPVAGADRLKLTEHIAIIDLMNLADALLLPLDDLALAVALKSPLFGVSEDELFTLAHGRERASLRAALTSHAAANDRFKEVLHRLEQCERRFRDETPFAFFAWLLGGDGGRARILRRLGHEANDALDEFLELALAYERKAPASLQGFVAWLRAADTEVKRDMEISRDEVRVMTVHGAKGLEAPVVLLLDTDGEAPKAESMGVLVDWPGEDAVPRRFTFLASESRPPACTRDALAAEQAARQREELNALYVALTRARTQLVLSATQPHRGDAGSWWQRLLPLAEPLAPPADEARGLPKEADNATFLLPKLPAAPADTAQDAIKTIATGDEATDASRIGEAMHRLLEWWQPGGTGWSAAQRLSVQREFGLTPAQMDAAADMAQHVLAGEGAWAWDRAVIDWQGNEVAMQHAGEALRLDRLVHRRDTGEWWVLDYKSAPRPEEQPELVAQMNRYRDAMRNANPGATVRVAFLTGEGRVVEVPSGVANAG